MEPPPDNSFDIFLSHNSKDKAIIRELKRLLQSQGLTVWFDEDELRPGSSWHDGIELGIRQSRSVAVLVGSDGMGPWEKVEYEIALVRAINMGWPVIPVLLPNAPTKPELPATLSSRAWVDLREQDMADGVQALIWGITGKKGETPRAPSGRKKPVIAGKPGRRFSARLNCLSEGGINFLHARAAMLVTQVCRAFGDETAFRLSRQGSDEEYDPKEVDFLTPMERFDHGVIVNVSVQGKMENLGSAFFLTVWEGLDGHSDDSHKVKLELVKKLEIVCERVVDHDLTSPDDAKALLERIPFVKEVRTSTLQESFRAVVTINDTPHKLTFPAIGLLAKHFGCQVWLAFELGEHGVYPFDLSQATNFVIDRRFYELKISSGARFTLVVSGRKRNAAGPLLVQFLKNLRQCDDWLRRRRIRRLDCDVAALLDFLSGVSHINNPATTAAGYFSVSSLLSRRNVFVNAADRVFSKEFVIEQLVTAHAHTYELDKDGIVEAIKASEKLQTVVSNHGVAILHVALELAPRISVSFGIYPSGVHWAAGEQPARLVVLVVYARDTAHCWHDCFKQLGSIFHPDPTRADQLVETANSDEFIKALRRMEENKFSK